MELMELFEYPSVCALFCGWLIWLAYREGGASFDEQLDYPHNGKHTILIRKKYKKYFRFNCIHQRHEFMKLGVIIQIIGNIGFLIAIVLAVLFLFIRRDNIYISYIIILSYLLGGGSRACCSSDRHML